MTYDPLAAQVFREIVTVFREVARRTRRTGEEEKMVGFFMFVMAVVVGVLALVGGLQWIELRHDRRQSVERADPSSSRLDRLESALGGLESRLDDLQEQQRFLERLLAERPERPSLTAGDEGAESDGVRSILFDTEPSEEDR